MTHSAPHKYCHALLNVFILLVNTWDQIFQGGPLHEVLFTSSSYSAFLPLLFPHLSLSYLLPLPSLIHSLTLFLPLSSRRTSHRAKCCRFPHKQEIQLLILGVPSSRMGQLKRLFPYHVVMSFCLYHQSTTMRL